MPPRCTETLARLPPGRAPLPEPAAPAGGCSLAPAAPPTGSRLRRSACNDLALERMQSCAATGALTAAFGV